ncbi:MAG: DNA recombination protein RmuC [Candidatus Pacebacteria bacterium]|nr:DNA recombination protein RmuC [Candidatus Paceibacterota bacterium]
MGREFYLLGAVILAGFLFLAWLLNKKLSRSQGDQALTEWLRSMQASVETTNKTLNEAMRSTDKNLSDTLRQTTQSLNERLDNAGRYIAQVAKEVGQMSEIGRSMKDLQEFLKSPKLRGNIGEEVLKDLISQMFPKNSFHLQYSFKSGEKVDAALRTDAGLLPIDSKFPMENFQKMVKAATEEEKEKLKRTFTADVKKHIRAIAKKYILPEEGTMDFALMYIPSEPVYYEIANIAELMTFARSLRVYPVSPTTLYASLQTILISFEGKKIEARTRQVFRLLRAIQKDYDKTGEALSVLSKHVGNAYNQMANASQSFSLLGQKLSSTQTLDAGEEKEELLEN